MIRVLIFDDSSTSRQLLCHMIDSAPDMQVVGELNDGRDAVQHVRKLRPDVILMDIVMPHVDGMSATAAIMASQPSPIVMISGTLEGREAELAFQAIKKGALTLLAKPAGPGSPDYEQGANHLISTVRAMSAVRVIHHTPEKKDSEKIDQTALKRTLAAPPEIIGIASSTGGPPALAEIFQSLPADFPLPIVVVQHIAGDFIPSLISWLKHVTPLTVQLAPIGEAPQPGNIYIAPANKHLFLDTRRTFQQTASPITSHMPSGDMLLLSLAKQYGAAAIGIILTGMGADGAQGLLAMRQQGAVTIAQDEKSSAVYGMPAEAKRIGAVQYSLSLNMMAPILKDLAERIAE